MHLYFKTFTVLLLTWTYLIHFELTFVYEGRVGSLPILDCVTLRSHPPHQLVGSALLFAFWSQHKHPLLRKAFPDHVSKVATSPLVTILHFIGPSEMIICVPDVPHASSMKTDWLTACTSSTSGRAWHSAGVQAEFVESGKLFIKGAAFLVYFAKN